jgi:hypothetical protein
MLHCSRCIEEKTYVQVEVFLHGFLTSALDVAVGVTGCLASHFIDAFDSLGESRAVEERKVSFTGWKSKVCVLQPVALSLC